MKGEISCSNNFCLSILWFICDNCKEKLSFFNFFVGILGLIVITYLFFCLYTCVLIKDCHEFKTLNARGCVSNLHTDYLNPMLYIMYAWNGLSKCMQKLEIFLKTMIIPFCSMSLSTILLLQTCESLIGFLLYVWLFSAYMYFICMKSFVIYMYSDSVL